jgi:hypothetical protein
MVMTKEAEQHQLKILHNYAEGIIGTRETMQCAGIEDYADLIIALSRHDPDLPKPADTPQRRAHVARASAILQPLLRRAD